ncbi:MAG: hypothetical protein IPL61_19720 [Myxococcales bacterium]|nr:hypothetical protein [Myxococcales bacterium]
MHTISRDNDHAQLDAPEEIERLLDHLHERFRASAPTLVTVERADNGDSLSIGLGAEVSVLNYVRGDPPYSEPASAPPGFFFGSAESRQPTEPAARRQPTGGSSGGRAARGRACARVRTRAARPTAPDEAEIRGGGHAATARAGRTRWGTAGGRSQAAATVTDAKRASQ